ncbi:hypothetical protein QOT17_004426 [Balamuthia mandrillaris]
MSKSTHIIVYNDTRKTVNIGTKNFIGWLSTEPLTPGETWTWDATDFFGNKYATNVWFKFGDDEIFAPLISTGKYNLSKLLKVAKGFHKAGKIANLIDEITGHL